MVGLFNSVPVHCPTVNLLTPHTTKKTVRKRRECLLTLPEVQLLVVPVTDALAPGKQSLQETLDAEKPFSSAPDACSVQCHSMASKCFSLGRNRQRVWRRLN